MHIKVRAGRQRKKRRSLDGAPHLFEGLEQVAAGDGQSDVDVMHDEQRLLLGLVGEVGQAVGYEQQQVYLRLLRTTRRFKDGSPTSHQEGLKDTYRTVVEQVEQGNEESPSMLSVAPDQCVQVRAERRVCVVGTKTSDHHIFGPGYGLLHLVRQLQPRDSFHLRSDRGRRRHFNSTAVVSMEAAASRVDRSRG